MDIREAAGVTNAAVGELIDAVDRQEEAFVDLEPSPRAKRLAAELDVVLMFHTGWEHSCKVISQQFTDPLKLERPLEHGGPVIAAHCGTCAWYDKEQYYPRFIEMMNRYENHARILYSLP